MGDFFILSYYESLFVEWMDLKRQLRKLLEESREFFLMLRVRNYFHFEALPYVFLLTNIVSYCQNEVDLRNIQFLALSYL